MMQHITAWWRSPCADAIHEHVYADQHTQPRSRTQIKLDYDRRWSSVTTPATRPELYDPLAPPQGWRYDAYYECWVEQLP